MSEIAEQTARAEEALERVKVLEADAEVRSTKLKETESSNRRFVATVGLLEQKVTEYDATINELHGTVAGLRCDCEEKDGRIAELDRDVREKEQVRRQLHNVIQELKGSIRVFVRVRPHVGGDLDTGEEVFSYPAAAAGNNPTMLKINTGQRESVTGERTDSTSKSFAFDHVFGPRSTQEEVFGEVAHLVQSALDGYHVCIFAYGQTGAGKTYTMEGTEDAPGVIPRTVEQVFSYSNELRAQGWAFTLDASFVEIYNDKCLDLLVTSGEEPQYLPVKIVDKDGSVGVAGLTSVEVTNPAQTLQLLGIANNTRATAKTRMNEASSRSHSVFTLRISGSHVESAQQIKGQLHLVDLAGSERVKKSGSLSDPVRFKEAQSINQSLMTLGNVILSLASKKKHVPFRDSTLTRLLQPSLGEGSKTLMFANLSPSAESVSESLSTLRFGTKVASCEVGQVRRNISTGDM